MVPSDPRSELDGDDVDGQGLSKGQPALRVKLPEVVGHGLPENHIYDRMRPPGLYNITPYLIE